jgi:hypothetical protein
MLFVKIYQSRLGNDQSKFPFDQFKKSISFISVCSVSCAYIEFFNYYYLTQPRQKGADKKISFFKNFTVRNSGW